MRTTALRPLHGLGFPLTTPHPRLKLWKTADSDTPTTSKSLTWEILRIAGPLSLSVGCFSLAMFIDRLMLFRFDPQAASASLAAGNVYWTIACLPVAAVGFANTLVAQRFGAARHTEIGPVVWQTIWMMIVCLPVFFLSAVFATPLFEWLGHSEELVIQEVRYFRILMTVPPALMIEAGLFAFFAGRGRTGSILAVNVCTCLANILLDWLLIFGPGVFPRLGVEGAAWATSVSMWLRTGLFAWSVWRVSRSENYGARNFRPQWPILRQLTVQGTSLGLHQAVRAFVMSAFVIQIGRIGEQGLQATTVILSWYQLAAMPLIGLGTATSVLIGQAMNDRRKSRRGIATSSIRLALAYTAVGGCLLIVFPGFVLGIFAEPSQLGRQLLIVFQPLTWLGAGYLVLEAMNQVLSGILKGISKVHLQLTSLIVATGLSMFLYVGMGNLRGHSVWLWSLLLFWSLAQFAIAAAHLVLGRSPQPSSQTREESLQKAA